MVEKIISGGQTGADQAALDVAIEVGIPHGGWIPKGRKTEDGRLPDSYRMQETDAIDYAQRTELNILDSDGTIIFSHGELSGGSALTQQLTKKHARPCLHIDLSGMSKYRAVEIIKMWLDIREIKVLNVAGSRNSEDPEIYEDVLGVLESLFYPPPEYISSKFPQTVAEAVDKLFSILPMKEKSSISKIKEDELYMLFPTLGQYIINGFGLNSGNESLINSCRYMRRKYDIDGDEASKLIIKELWKKLKETHSLKVVK